jgi:uncharacterized membrane protein
MNVIETAKERAREVAAKVLHASETEPRSQSITIRAPRQGVAEFFQDAERLSVVFGDIAEVEHLGPHRLRWTFAGGEAAVWECAVTADDSRVEFNDVQSGNTAQVLLELRDASGDRGTEVVARISTPAPGLLTGPLTFKALYRARALLQTGEVPTLHHNPSARASDR